MKLFSKIFSPNGARSLSAAHPRENAPPADQVPARSKDIISDEDEDGRSEVHNATIRPYSSICLIHSFRNAGETSAVGGGTGWLVSPNTVLTAAHVVYDRKYFSGATRPRAGGVQMWFGFNNDAEAPFGNVVSTKIFVPPAFRDYYDPDWDLALIKLDTRIGDRVGWFDVQSPPPAALKNKPVTVAGYPGEEDKRFRQYESEKSILDVSETRIYHSVDTTKGQSGAPLFRPGGNRATAFGVHARGTYEARQSIGISANFAVRFRPEILKWMKRPT